MNATTTLTHMSSLEAAAALELMDHTLTTRQARAALTDALAVIAHPGLALPRAILSEVSTQDTATVGDVYQLLLNDRDALALDTLRTI